ncbi:hypothetical protein [Shewanella phaeophyticola]|uniref:DUF2971 domain-containing protein n=1 Tax=Shewanella phaeophyticola TaxID=2978345 RepID=A0ABT2P0H3_9GAMM|nr:hypothetical protein [Shewanella sp. KJ10-1]MCT8985957.1 hypothetical protein [Shewanella sp. KJ10-1]
MSSEYALDALKNQEIKVSKFNDLNDPFELMAMSLEDKLSRKVLVELKEKLNKKLRLLSCSKSWSSPLLWGHYADKHKGIALKLEVPDDHAVPVIYSPDRSSIDLHRLMRDRDDSAKQELFKMFVTKYEQ